MKIIRRMTASKSRDLTIADVDAENVAKDFGLVADADSEADNAATHEQHVLPSIVDADDDELQGYVAGILRQDQVAFGLLFKAMAARVYSLALRITDDAQLAEEVTEDTFFQVWRQAPRYDSTRGTARAWVLTIARSRALDARRAIPPFEELPDLERESHVDEQSHDSVPDLLSAVEQNHLLHEAIKKLEPLPRQLLTLSFFRGLSHEEIADQSGLPLGTVKSHIRRAVIALREALAGSQPVAIDL